MHPVASRSASQSNKEKCLRQMSTLQDVYMRETWIHNFAKAAAAAAAASFTCCMYGTSMHRWCQVCITSVDSSSGGSAFPQARQTVGPSCGCTCYRVRVLFTKIRSASGNSCLNQRWNAVLMTWWNWVPLLVCSKKRKWNPEKWFKRCDGACAISMDVECVGESLKITATGTN